MWRRPCRSRRRRESFIEITDAAAATLAAVDRGAPGVYNVVDSDPAPVAEWLPYLAKVVGANPPLRVPAWLGRLLAGEFVVVQMTSARGSSNEKARKELGWEPRYASWREGFRACGRQRVVRLLVGLLRRGRTLGASLRLAWVNGQPGAVMYDAAGRVVTVVGLDVADGVVQAIRSVVNPDKLGHIGPVSDVARRPEKESAVGAHEVGDADV